MKKLILNTAFATLSLLAVNSVVADTINVLDYGAVGDGVTDDSAAFQAAFNVTNPDITEVEIPPGRFVITTPLTLSEKLCWTIKGSGPTYLVWKGAAGATMLTVNGARGCTFRDLYFEGEGIPGNKAGILMLMKNGTAVNMQNLFNHVSFTKATVGLQFGTSITDVNCSDVTFNYVCFANLGTGMLVKNSQGVDFNIDYLFGWNCGSVLFFERGGNVLVNTAQLTDCDVFLKLTGGGPTNGTYIANNVRLERGVQGRSQLLVANNPSPFLANVHFTGFTDAQWNWANNTGDSRNLPILDVGPRTMVTMQNSIFAGPPMAKLAGFTQPAACGTLVTRECMFIGFNPATDTTAITANATGYYQLINNFDGVNAILPNVQKWPTLATVVR